MQSLYFVFFCLLISYVIYWCFRNDDLADFDDEVDGKDGKKYNPTKKQ